MSDKLPDGAGIVVVKKFDDKYKVLGLRLYGKYDIPKGGIEEGEEALIAAVRETEEESCISELSFSWGLEPLVIEGKAKITVYIAETLQEPVIKKNPHTGIYEHHAAAWVEWDFMENRVYNYLKPAIIWAKGVVNDV